MPVLFTVDLFPLGLGLGELDLVLAPPEVIRGFTGLWVTSVFGLVLELPELVVLGEFDLSWVGLWLVFELALRLVVLLGGMGGLFCGDLVIDKVLLALPPLVFSDELLSMLDSLDTAL